MRAAGVGPYEDDDTNVRQTEKNCSSTNFFWEFCYNYLNSEIINNNLNNPD